MNLAKKGCLGFLMVIIIYLIIVFFPFLFPRIYKGYVRMKIDFKERVIENKTINSYVDELNIKPNKKNTNFNLLIQEFKNQNNRFEFDKNEFRYNDKSFFLRDTPKQTISILGKPDRSRRIITYRYPTGRIKCFDNEDRLSLDLYNYPDNEKSGYSIFPENHSNYDYKKLKELREKELKKLQEKYGDSFIEISDIITQTYENPKLTLRFAKYDNTQQHLLASFEINFDTSYSPLNIILFRGTPYKISMKMYDFLDLSNLTRDDLDSHSLFSYCREAKFNFLDFEYTKYFKI